MVMESDPWLSQEFGEKLDLLDRLHREKQKDFSQSFGDAWLFTLLRSARDGGAGNIRGKNETGKKP